MTPFERASLEAARRIEVLPAEVAAWLAASQANVAGLGIHGSQLLALRDLMDTLVARQRRLLAERPSAAGSRAYADAELEFTAELVGASELWSAFRAVFEQRHDPRLVRGLDAADLVAASAYGTAMDQAAGWAVVGADECREPPLVCCEAVGSPASVARGRDVAGLAGTIRRYRGRPLPLPMVLFPADRLDDAWTHCSLMHEVGHCLEADLAFTTEAVDGAMAALEAAGVPATRVEVWRRWGEEVVADAVGVALGGAGFAANLGSWLLPIALGGIFDAPGDDPHPPPSVRIRVLAGFLAAGGPASWDAIAVELDADAAAIAAPAWQQPFSSDARAVAAATLTTPLEALDGHRILDLAPDLAAEAADVELLARYLRWGINRTPAPAGPPPFPTRLVPSAAALALRLDPAPGDLAGIATRALGYIGAIPRPAFLAGGAAAGRRAHLRRLAENLDVVQ